MLPRSFERRLLGLRQVRNRLPRSRRRDMLGGLVPVRLRFRCRRWLLFAWALALASSADLRCWCLSAVWRSESAGPNQARWAPARSRAKPAHKAETRLRRSSVWRTKSPRKATRTGARPPFPLAIASSFRLVHPRLSSLSKLTQCTGVLPIRAGLPRPSRGALPAGPSASSGPSAPDAGCRNFGRRDRRLRQRDLSARMSSASCVTTSRIARASRPQGARTGLPGRCPPGSRSP